MRSGSVACCSPDTRSRYEDPAAPGPRPASLSRARHRSGAGCHGRPRAERGRQEHDPAGHRTGTHPTRDQYGRGSRLAAAVGRQRRHAAVGRDRVRAGRGGRAPRDRLAREVVRRPEGHRRPRVRRAARQRPGARRPGPGRAVRRPDGVVLPFDRVGPSSRAERPCPRRSRVARSAPGEHQRRRPRYGPRQEAPRPGDLRTDDQGRQEPGAAQGRRNDRRHDRGER